MKDKKLHPSPFTLYPLPFIWAPPQNSSSSMVTRWHIAVFLLWPTRHCQLNISMAAKNLLVRFLHLPICFLKYGSKNSLIFSPLPLMLDAPFVMIYMRLIKVPVKRCQTNCTIKLHASNNWLQLLASPFLLPMALRPTMSLAHWHAAPVVRACRSWLSPAIAIHSNWSTLLSLWWHRGVHLMM